MDSASRVSKGFVSGGLVLGTEDGVWLVDADGGRRLALAGKRVGHVAGDAQRLLAAVPRDGLYLVSAEAGEHVARRIWEGNANSCAIGRDGAGYYVGAVPAMIHCSEDGGASWQALEAIDQLPTRPKWTFPPPPHHPQITSIDFLPDQAGSLLAGVEVGGVLFSRDGGLTFEERSEGVYTDVHSVRPDARAPGHLFAATGDGFYASEDAGRSWEKRMAGIRNSYAIGLHVNPARAGELLITVGDRPPGLNGLVYHSLDGGRSWAELRGRGLPEAQGKASVPFFAAGAAWLGTHRGELLRADDPRGAWSVVHALPAPIHAVAGEGSPSSVLH